MHLFIKYTRKVTVTVLGFGLLILGIVMFFTPGPGWLFIILGLGLLATEYVWAKNSLEFAKEKYEKAKLKASKKFKSRNKTQKPDANNK